jgi:hypothetical protein
MKGESEPSCPSRALQVTTGLPASLAEFMSRSYHSEKLLRAPHPAWVSAARQQRETHVSAGRHLNWRETFEPGRT